ncbi:hypothetical protein BKA69DRAFT_1059854 [Paraphysoderma sedebokerense]|nr:hypothetical protein BKA69DRAFT_1059854 [Paraphysoderma sedebokerense]
MVWFPVISFRLTLMCSDRKLNSNYPPKFFGTAKKGSFSTKEEKEKERVEEAKDDANSLLPPTASWATKKPTIVGRPIAQPPSRTSSFVSESESETHLTNGEQFEDSHSSRTEAEDSRPVSSSSHSKSPAESPKSESRLQIPSTEAPSMSAPSAETTDMPSFDLTSIINSIPAEVPTLKVLDQVPDKSKDDTLLSPGHFSRLSHLVGGTPQTYSGSFNPFGPANDGIALSANGVQQNFEHIPPPGIGNTLRPPVLQNHNSPNPLALHSNTAGHDPGFGLLNRLLSQSSAPSAPTPIPPPTVFDPFGDVDSRLPPFSTTSPNPAPSRRTGQSRFNFARERSFTPPPTGSPLLQDPIFPGRTEVAPNAMLPFGPKQAFNRQAASPGMAPPPGLNLDQVNIPGIDNSRALPPQLNSVAADLKSNQKSKVSSKFAFANTDEPTPHPSSLQKSSLSEADDFLGQFLKAAKQSNTPVVSQVNEPAFPFSDPAIMSVRLGPENHDATPPPSQSNRRLKVFQTFQGSSPEGQVTSPSNPSNSSPNQNMDSPALTVPPQRPANDSRNVTAQPSQKKVNQSTKPPISNQEARKGDQASRIPPPATQLFTIDTQKSPPSKKGGKTVKIKQSDNVQQNKRKESQTDNKQGNGNQKVESKVANTPSAKSTVESGNQQNGATAPLEPTLSSNSDSLPAISNKAAPELASSPSVAPANKKKKKKKQQQQSSQDKDESTNTSKADVAASVTANANQSNTKSAKATSHPQVNASQNSTNTQFPSHPLDLSNLSQLGLGSLSNFFSFPSSSSSSNPQSSVTLTLNGSGILGTIGNLDANGTAQFASTPADLRTLEQQVEFAKKEAAMLEQELLKIIKRNSSVSLE